MNKKKTITAKQREEAARKRREAKQVKADELAAKQQQRSASAKQEQSPPPNQPQKRMTKSLYVLPADQDRLNQIAGGLLSDGIRSSESIIIRAALAAVDPTSEKFKDEIRNLASSRSEAIRAGIAKREARKGKPEPKKPIKGRIIPPEDLDELL